MYALNLSEDRRILSACVCLEGFDYETIVDELPNDDISDYKYIDNEFVYEPLPKVVDNSARIAELKQNLADTDYVVIKIAEGVATWEEYPTIKEQRQAWRDEINELSVEQG